MKTRKLITAVVWVVAATLVWSCSENEVTPEIQEEISITDNILIGSNSVLNRVRGNGFGGPMGAIFGNYGRAQGRSASPLSMMKEVSHTKSVNDSTDNNIPDCLTESWEDDGNGNYTYTLDFGDGCDYYGEFLKGKLVETGSYSDNSFNASVTYTNFGGNDWMIDGTYTYSGTWEDNSNSEDSTNWNFNATYEFTADLTEQYTDYGYPEDSTQASTGETIVTVDYVANGKETMDQDGYVVQSRNVSVSTSTNEAFTSSVDSPLVYDYTCEADNVWTYTSGVESGSYTYGDQTGSYSIDYGDGTCDNIIFVTENGVTEEIDLGAEWEDWEEECGNDHNG
ncbi:MAG: hypothetical protein RIM99_14280 [Cyclobacteriaceae bacterium]